jgi:hypothetical protein
LDEWLSRSSGLVATLQKENQSASARGASTIVSTARLADEMHGRVVVVNPDEDCSPAAFRVLVDELLGAPEPEIESLDAVDVLAVIRAESEHA